MTGTTPLTGMAWDHPRAYRPLEAFAERPGVPRVAWSRQPLADFEARPLESLAPDHDFLIVDHPGLGRALRTGAIRPWDEVFDADELAGWAATSVGPTWASYRLDGRQWALPIDAATQVSVVVAGAAPLPTRWSEVADRVRATPTALCVGGPHAALMLLGMCADETRTGDDLLDPATAVPAIELLAGLWPSVDREVSTGDPIQVHAAIAAGAVDYCPLAYGYASYAQPARGARALAWGDAPAYATDLPGSTLGGTGLALSARRDSDLDDVRAWVRGFLTTDVQTGLVPAHSGQPAHRDAWTSPQVDREWGGYYGSTLRSVETSWTRPRYDGWVALQDEASELVREAIGGTASASAVVDEINARHARAVKEQA